MPGADLRGVVTDADDGVGVELVGVGDHVPKGIVAGVFAHFGVNGDVAAEQALDIGADVADDRPGADDDAAHHAKVLDHAIARESGTRSL